MQQNINEEERKAAYAADVTYVTNSELGFGAPQNPSFFTSFQCPVTSLVFNEAIPLVLSLIFA